MSNHSTLAGAVRPTDGIQGLHGYRSLALAGAAGLACTSLAWALWRFGATEIWELQRLFLLSLVAAAIVMAALPLAALRNRRLLPLLAVGGFLLSQIVRLPSLQARGYVLASLGWLGIFLGLTLARYGRGLARALLLFLVAVAAGEAFYGLVQAIGGVDAIGSYERGLGALATGSFINRNHFAGLLNMSLALALGMVWLSLVHRRSLGEAAVETRAWSWLVVLACSFMGLAILLSLSRGGTISLLLTVVFLAGLMVRGRRRGPGMARALPWVLLMTILGLGLAVGLDALLARFSELDEHEGRLKVYADTLELIGEHPLVGVGPGMYRWRFRPYQTAQTNVRYDHAHNDYLQTAAEWGIAGSLLLWGFVFWRFYRACRLFLANRDPRRRSLALGCAGAILSILLHSLADFNLQIPTNLMVFGLILGLAWSADLGELGSPAATEEPEPPQAGWPTAAASGARVALRVVLLGLLVVVGWTVFRQYRAAALGHRSPTFERLREALLWNPEDPVVHFRLGIGHRDVPQHRDLRKARRHLERAVDLSPFSWMYRRQLGAVYELLGRGDEAGAAYLEAVRLNPRSADYRWRLANFELRRGDLAAAVDQIARALDLDLELGPAALSLMIKAGADWQNVDRAWPHDFAARRNLLHLVSRRRAASPEVGDPGLFLQTLWQQLLAADEPLSIADGSVYIQRLLAGPDGGLARRAWLELTGRNGLIDEAYESSRNLVWNGDFERSLKVSGLGWTVGRQNGFRVQRVEGEGPNDSGALRIEFDGSANLDFWHVQQQVVVAAGGAHRLEARLRTREISTEQGLALEVLDAEGRLLLATEKVTGTSPWHATGGTLVVPDNSAKIVVRLRRNRSLRIDNKLGGTAWIDDVRLMPVKTPAARL